MQNNSKSIFYVALFFSMVAWGGSWVNAKVLSGYIDEFEMIFFRFGITAVTMIPIIFYLKKSFKIDLKSFGLVLLSAVVFIAYMKYFFLGTKYGTASLGGAFVTTLIPINTFIFLVVLGDKKITKKDIFALVLGAIGVMSMLNVWEFNKEEILVPQNLYFIIASILWPILTIISSKSTKISPLVFTFYLYIVTVVFDLLFFVDLKALEYQKFDAVFYLNIATISILATTFANSIYFLGIERLGASEVSSFIFLVPISAIVLSAVFLKEHISLSIIIGTVLTLIAIKILNDIKLNLFNKFRL